MKQNNTTQSTNQSALQITTFDFYGNELIALKDNATGEVYTAINTVLRNIGFKNTQVRYHRNKWINDLAISQGVHKFSIPSNGGYQISDCITSRLLPFALAKINISVRTKREYPELVKRLLLYQDKCADVLAAVFIDHTPIQDIQFQEVITVLNRLGKAINTLHGELQYAISEITNLNNHISSIEQQISKPIPKRKYSYWTTKMFPKYQALADYLQISYKELYKLLFKELQDTYSEIDLNQLVDDFCYENKLENCYTLDAIEHDKEVRKLFESVVNNMLHKYELNEN
ncbi:phage antirepressor N-terminal domain-containing protein [Fusicatenibacter sp. CLA-AA-H241]|nr:phage antirepressor N-terminal domain-containing protein [Oliverpabstia intestinalis]